MPDSEYAEFLLHCIGNAQKSLIDDANLYVWYAALYYPLVLSVFEKLGIMYDSVPITWVKGHFTMSWAHLKRRSEFCLLAGKGMPTKSKRFFGGAKADNVWEVNVEHNSTYIHPTQKPLALVTKALALSSKEGELILDLFAGSGSTMLAAIQNDRYCYTMEQEPAFCDAIVRRMFAYAEKSGKALVIKRNGAVLTEEEFQCAS